MISFNRVIFALLVLSPAIPKVALAVTIDSPVSVVQCQPLALTWHGSATTGEIYISAVEGKDTSSIPLIQFMPQPATPSGEGSLTWPKVNLTAGTQFTLIVSDANGAPNFSGEATVLQGSGTCDLVNSNGASGDSKQALSGSTPTSQSGPNSSGTSKSAAAKGSTSIGSTATSMSGSTAQGTSHNSTTPGSTSGVAGQVFPGKFAAGLVAVAIIAAIL